MWAKEKQQTVQSPFLASQEGEGKLKTPSQDKTALMTNCQF
jgi:hypothetical protein